MCPWPIKLWFSIAVDNNTQENEPITLETPFRQIWRMVMNLSKVIEFSWSVPLKSDTSTTLVSRRIKLLVKPGSWVTKVLQEQTTSFLTSAKTYQRCTWQCCKSGPSPCPTLSLWRSTWLRPGCKRRPRTEPDCCSSGHGFEILLPTGRCRDRSESIAKLECNRHLKKSLLSKSFKICVGPRSLSLRPRNHFFLEPDRTKLRLAYNLRKSLHSKENFGNPELQLRLSLFYLTPCFNFRTDKICWTAVGI